MDMKKIGRLITAQRKALGYTQEDLGKVLSVSDKAVSKWERGLSCPDVSLLSKLAVALKISLAQLQHSCANNAFVAAVVKCDLAHGQGCCPQQ